MVFTLYGVDKWKAKRQKWRISEMTLLGMAFVFGAAGAFAGMLLFHHKTRKWEIPDSGATVFAVAGGRGILDPEMRRRREMQIFIAALGGALGASARYGLSLLPGKWDFPVWTFLTNLCGAVIIGFLAGILAGEAQESSRNVALFWKTGFCGGFTTFSTFSLEAWNLLEQGKMLTGGLYIVGSVVCCLAGICLGKFLAAR